MRKEEAEEVQRQISLSNSEVDSERPRRPRSLSSWRSRSSFRRSRTNSAPRNPRDDMHRVHSAHFIDDSGTYTNEQDQVDLNAERESTGAEAESVPVEDEHEAPDPMKEREKEDVESQDFEPASGNKTKLDTAELEKGTAPSLKRQKTCKSSRSQKDQDPNLVSWSENDPENPRDWPIRRKWIATFVVSSFTFISPVSSSMVAPALPDMARDLGIHNQVESQMMLSIFVLAYAIGPLLLGPLSEVYGRVPVLQLANLVFLIFNLACGFARDGAEMLVFRFFAGLGGSAPLAIGGGILADCFSPEQRGKAISVYSLAPLIGPAAGPVAGGFIAQNTTWRWVFWAISIADAAIQISGLFFLQETWAPKLLENKAKRLRKETGNDDLYTDFATREPVLKKLETSLSRPFRMFFTQPIIIILACYMAYLYGMVYLVISTFPALYSSPKYYGESVQIGGLHFIALAIGYTLGAQISGRANDRIYKRLKQRSGGVGKPEFRVPVMIPGAILLPIGFLWYGWSAEGHVFWLMPDIGAGILAAATICSYYAIQTYVIDCYTKYAASAIAAITVLRSMAGFGFPLFAPAMYDALGYGWGNTVLAAVAAVIGLPAPWLFWKYGPGLRANSQYAAG